MNKIKTQIFAHRGASGIVEHENTIQAFQKAIDVASDGIEVDVRRTKDLIMVINHDPIVFDKAIKDLTYRELCDLTKEHGYQIPTFEETLQFVKGKIFIDIELKEAGYEIDVVNTINKYLDIDAFYIRSFDPNILVQIKAIDPNIKTVLLIAGAWKDGFCSLWSKIFPRRLIKYSKCDLISPHYRLMILGFVFRMRIRKMPISVWTVNTEDVMKKMYKKKVEYIITNYPNIALDVKNKMLK